MTVAREARRPGRLALVALGVLAVALSSRVTATVPGSSVPQSAQTLVVLLVGALLGARSGAATLVAWLLVGGLGGPVFADGASGWGHLVGPSAGYLLGFVVAAAAVGRLADRGLLDRPGPALGAMLGGHGVILALGWARLAWTLEAVEAFRQGVAPFLAGAVLKSVGAAAVVVVVERATGPSSGDG